MADYAETAGVHFTMSYNGFVPSCVASVLKDPIMRQHQQDLYDLYSKKGLISSLVGDGRPLLLFTGLILTLSGGFALFLAATGQFLPHDTQFLGMTADELCTYYECRIVRFMIHDRVAFGGALIAVGTLYMWLVQFPLRRREAWAWWAFAISGVLGFASFLAYLGYGYLDTWHGVATILLLPFFIVGLWRTRPDMDRMAFEAILRTKRAPWTIRERYGLGRNLLTLTAGGMIAAGATILIVGMTSVFVPQDLHFMDLQRADLDAINPRLIPLIAHDRAGFGGGLLTIGVTVFFINWFARPSRSLWQALLIAGTSGFGGAIGIHFIVGYVDFVHLAPAVLGLVIFLVGLALTHEGMSGTPLRSVRSSTELME